MDKLVIERMITDRPKDVPAHEDVDEARKKELERLEVTRNSFNALFDEAQHNEQIKGGAKRLSFKAMQAALLIYLYQDEPLFQVPYRLLKTMIDIDEGFSSWRYKHSTVSCINVVTSHN